MEEATHPWRGIRLSLWVTLSISAIIGLFVMVLRAASGELISISDLVIQVSSLLIFVGFFLFDKNRVRQ